MVAHVLLAAGLDPTVFLGGDLPAIGGNARAGQSDVVLAEACEAYDGFLYLYPQIAVVLNVEADHLDYHGDEAHVIASFERFVGQVQCGGTVIVCADDAKALDLLGNSVRDGTSVSTYGLADGGAGADITAADVSSGAGDNGPEQTFLLVRWGEVMGRVRLQVPGLHNVRNALAAASVGFALGLPAEQIIAGLEAFGGTGRRFERIGEAAACSSLMTTHTTRRNCAPRSPPPGVRTRTVESWPCSSRICRRAPVT
jgi:UDP-N-acetylmuramate--alanine ligase